MDLTASTPSLKFAVALPVLNLSPAGVRVKQEKVIAPVEPKAEARQSITQAHRTAGDGARNGKQLYILPAMCALRRFI